MKAIIAVNNLGFIGLNDGLPWKCPDDLKHFKAMTSGEQIKMLVGHNTFQTLPKVVKDRGVILDKRDKVFAASGVVNVGGTGNFVEHTIICIGGKKTYEKYCHMFTELHISHINDNTVGDTMFPDFKNLNPDCKVFNYHFEVKKPTNDL